MKLGTAWSILVGMVAVAVALGVAGTNPVAAACLLSYAVLVALELDSDAFRSFAEENEQAISIFKVVLLLVAFLDLFL